MAYDKSAQRDEQYIKQLTSSKDLTKASDIETVYSLLQTDRYVFESDLGRKFDDKIFELHEKVQKGEIRDVDNKKNKGKISKNDNSLKLSNKNNTVSKSNNPQYEQEVNKLVVLELKKRERRRKLLIVIAALVAIFSLGYFGFYNYISSRTSNQYEQLSALKGSDVLVPRKEKLVVNKQDVILPDILSDYATLYVKNNKLAGWLKIDGTNIDYPVMQTNDNEYYLNHNFNNEKDNNGCLFLDCECTLFPKSTNMIIYGHHMKSGNMFGNLQRYAKESYYLKHKKIHFDTIYEKGTYEVMYVFYSKVYDNDELIFKYYQFINANSENEFNYYMSEMQKLSLYDTGVTASYGDTLLTLSTCDHSQEDGRFAVVARKID